MKLPEKGLSADALFEELEGYRQNDVPWRDGRTWAYVYDPGPEAEAVAKRAFSAYLSDNALDPTAFPSLLRFENDILSMAIAHLGGTERSAGTFTSGGTESIMLAVKAAREHARAHRPEVKRPNIVLPTTAHAAFHKAAFYLGLELKLVSVEDESFVVSPEKMDLAIDENTVLIVGSAPSYAHGVIDPIEALGQVALRKNVFFHVDACVGGFMLPFLARVGATVPRFNLEVDGVTSISMDLHKYAYCPKGASVVVYKDRALREHQIYACARWTGYTIVNPTVQSSKSGGPLAAAWATLRYIGEGGYLRLAEAKHEATKKVVAGIGEIAGLRVLGTPGMNLVAFASDEVSVFHVADEMKVRGWYVQPQLAFENSPANIHLSVNPANAKWVEALLADLRESVEAARRLGPSPLAAMAGDFFGAMGDQPLSDEAFGQILELAGMSGVGLPGRMADVNEVLNALPAQLRGELLKKFMNALFVASK